MAASQYDCEAVIYTCRAIRCKSMQDARHCTYAACRMHCVSQQFFEVNIMAVQQAYVQLGQQCFSCMCYMLAPEV